MPNHTTANEDLALRSINEVLSIVDRLDELVSEKEAEIEMLNAKIDKRDEVIEDLNAQIADLQSQIDQVPNS